MRRRRGSWWERHGFVRLLVVGFVRSLRGPVGLVVRSVVVLAFGERALDFAPPPGPAVARRPETAPPPPLVIRSDGRSLRPAVARPDGSLQPARRPRLRATRAHAAASRRRAAGERGQVTPFVALLVLAAGGLCIGLGRLGSDAVDAGRARTAADAAALAGAAGGEDAARSIAEANAGDLVSFDRLDGGEVEVRVRVGRATAVARAVGTETGGGGGGARAGLVPELLAALRVAEQALGERVAITSGWRSSAQQQALWARRATNPFPVAPPGSSTHERGEAADLPRSAADRLAAVGPAVGLCRPLPRTDPVHFELCRPTRGP